MEPKSKSRAFGLILVVLATMCWSSSGIFISFIIKGSGISSLGLAFWRDITTAVAFGVGLLLFAPKKMVVNRKDLVWLAGMGALSIGSFHVLWNASVQSNGVAIATILQSNAPIFVTFAAYFLWKERLSVVKFIALMFSVIGTVLISDINQLGQTNITTLGIVIGVASAINYGTFSLFGKKLRGDYDSVTILFYAFVFGALVLFPFQLFLGDPVSVLSPVAATFAMLILVSTILGFSLYSTALKYLEAGVASITAMAEIPFAAIASYIFLGERLSLWQVVGGILVVSGVLLVTIRTQKAQPEHA